jgi:hypothetical protein
MTSGSCSNFCPPTSAGSRGNFVLPWNIPAGLPNFTGKSDVQLFGRHGLLLLHPPLQARQDRRDRLGIFDPGGPGRPGAERRGRAGVRGAVPLGAAPQRPGQDHAIERPVQESGVEEHIASLKANDILFIDSTHTVKPGGDCLYIYLKLLPKVPAGVVVHAHDIYLPFMFPEGNLLLQQYWIEQYLLWAYLLDNPRVKILYGSKYHHAFNRDALTEFMGGAYAPGGASFYFEFVK